MEKVRKFIKHYREGGLRQAGRVTWNYYRPELRPHAIRKYGWRHGIPYGTARAIFKLLPSDETGTNVFEYEWDVLIVLDTCRPEWIEVIESEYEMIDSYKTIRSVGGRTSEWVPRTFEAVSSCERPVTYIHGSKYGDAADTHDIQKIFVKSDDFLYPPAHRITDRALDTLGRDDHRGRTVVHYAQPHFPVFETDGSRSDVEVLSTTAVREWASGRSIDELDSMYISNLKYVMDECAILVENLDGYSILLTADHGQLLGEYGVVGHPHGVRHDAVRNVPLVRIT